jgi:hypothetical protein
VGDLCCVRVTWFATTGEGVLGGCLGKQDFALARKGRWWGSARSTSMHVNMRLTLAELFVLPGVFTFTCAT